MASEPLWLTFADLVAIHADQLRLFGGLPGIRDENLVHSAIAAPRNLFLYDGEEDALVLAIRLCTLIARNHGFTDGNKRTATAAMIELLAINGIDLVVPDDEIETPLLGQWIERLAAGKLNEAQLRDRLEPFAQERE